MESLELRRIIHNKLTKTRSLREYRFHMDGVDQIDIYYPHGCRAPGPRDFRPYLGTLTVTSAETEAHFNSPFLERELLDPADPKFFRKLTRAISNATAIVAAEREMREKDDP